MKILIIGASGYLGGMLYKKCSLDNNIEFYGTYCSLQKNISMLKLDVMDTVNSQKIIKDINPDVIVWCLKNENDEINLTKTGLTNILSIIPEHVRFIYISTLVSSKSNQDENITPELVSTEKYHSVYVNGKIHAEELIKTHKNHVIIRPGQIFGFDADGQADIRMNRILTNKEKGNKHPCAVNSQISIVHVEDLVNGIYELFHNDFTGIINIAAQQPVSYYYFYRLLANMIGIDDNIIVPVFSETLLNSFFDTTKCRKVLTSTIRNF